MPPGEQGGGKLQFRAMNAFPEATAPTPADLARRWLDAASIGPGGSAAANVPLPASPFEALAAVCDEILVRGQTLLLVVADDACLADVANALDLAIRPLCLVLPLDDFTARITLRATLALLRSRLARREDERPDLWSRQRERIEANDALWHAAQAWSAAESADPWPAGIETLFPVRVVPAGRLGERVDADDLIVPFDVELPAGIAARGRVLRFGGAGGPAANPPQDAVTVADPQLHLRTTLEAVSREIAELELELATVQGELADFTLRYHRAVGDRLVELDALRAELATAQVRRADADPAARQAEAAAQARADASREEQRRHAETALEQEKRFRPTADVKKLFRQVAQRIHPDRARDDDERAWRTQLMAEANRAYRNGDLDALHEVLALWQEGHREAESTRTPQNLLELQLERLRRRLMQIQRELDGLLASRLYELLLAARQARRQNRDLLHEMSVKLDGDIAEVRTRLAGLTRT